MEESGYEKIAEINGRWKADLIESFLKAEGIDVLLIQDAVTHYLYKSAFDPVEIHVPKSEVSRARELLKSFEEIQPETDDEDADADAE